MGVKRTSGLPGPWGQVAPVVQEQEVAAVLLAQPAGQIQVALAGEEFLYQTLGRSEEDGVPASTRRWPLTPIRNPVCLLQ